MSLCCLLLIPPKPFHILVVEESQTLTKLQFLLMALCSTYGKPDILTKKIWLSNLYYCREENFKTYVFCQNSQADIDLILLHNRSASHKFFGLSKQQDR